MPEWIRLDKHKKELDPGLTFCQRRVYDGLPPMYFIRSLAAEVQLSEPEAFTFASQLPEVQAIISDLRESAKVCRNRQQLFEGLGDPAADEWREMAERFEAHLVPFQGLFDD